MEIKLSKQFIAEINQLMMDADEEELAELQEMLDELKKAAEDGTILENSEHIDLNRLRIEEPEVYAQVTRGLEEVDDD